jgi:hypothetical protein
MPEQEKPTTTASGFTSSYFNFDKELISQTIKGYYNYIIHPESGDSVQIDPDQLWFWTEAWQAGEREVDEYLRQGEYEVFDSMDDFLDTL